MKFILLASIFGVAACAPAQVYMEFDIRHAPPQAVQAIPAGVPLDALDVLLPVDDQKQLLGGPVRGFIKQEIPQPNGRESKDVYYAFGFDQPVPAPVDPAATVVIVPAVPAAPVAPADPVAPAAPADPVAPAAPAAPVAPVAPVAPAAPVVPAAPVKTAKAAAAPAAKGDDDDDDDD